MLFSAVTLVIQVTRTALEANREAIEVLYLVGAHDRFIDVVLHGATDEARLRSAGGRLEVGVDAREGLQRRRVARLLGEQALRLVVMSFIIQRFRPRLRFFPVSQQSLAIGALLVNDRVIAMAVHLSLGVQPLPWSYWLAPLLGMLLWGPVYVALDALRIGAWRKR